MIEHRWYHDKKQNAVYSYPRGIVWLLDAGMFGNTQFPESRVISSAEEISPEDACKLISVKCPDGVGVMLAVIDGRDAAQEPPGKNRPYESWPSDGSPIDMDKLVKPVVHAVNQLYKLERNNPGKDVDWDGPNLGYPELAVSSEPKERLSAKELQWIENDQGRSALEEVVILAIQLGIEQGRRLSAVSDPPQMAYRSNQDEADLWREWYRKAVEDASNLEDFVRNNPLFSVFTKYRSWSE